MTENAIKGVEEIVGSLRTATEICVFALRQSNQEIMNLKAQLKNVVELVEKKQ